MKQSSGKFISIVFFLFILLLSHCKENYSSKITGVWKVNKVELLISIKDSSKILNETKDATISFFEGGKFVSIRNVGGATKKYTGSYSIKGKYLIQDKDHAEILTLNDKELILKIPDTLVVRFTRVETTN